MTTETGTVKFFNGERGYGFIHLADGTDLFFHVTEVAHGDSPVEGRAVSFRRGLSRDGRPRAINVNVTTGA
jgi:CspA family cold shock protein